MIPYGRQSISEEDIKAVVDVLRSDFLTQGPVVERFEEAVAAYCGAKYAVAVNSATSALHIACLAAGLGPEDTLWTSPNTFVASANCALYCNASVDFVDIDPFSYNMSVAELERKLVDSERKGRVPKVVVPVHFAGQPCEMAQIHKLAGRYGFSVIEDASHAIGAEYRNEKIGSCSYSDMTVFSFHPVKIITTGEGGMVLTNRRDLYEKLLRLRSHGITRNSALMTEPFPDRWYYEQVELGFNYRLSDIHAALGLSQLSMVDEFIARRHCLAESYDSAFQGEPLTTPWRHPESYSSFHLYVVKLNGDEQAVGRKEFFDALRQAGINVNVHYIPVYLQPYYRSLGFSAGYLPVSEAYYRRAVTLPLYFELSDSSQQHVIETVREALRRN